LDRLSAGTANQIIHIPSDKLGWIKHAVLVHITDKLNQLDI